MEIKEQKLERDKIQSRAMEIFKGMKAVCEWGGCQNHGQEFCNKDAAWDAAVRQAEDENY